MSDSAPLPAHTTPETDGPKPDVDLGGLTWPAAARIAAQTVVVVPVGSTEQHGPHLPLSTDGDVAVGLSRALAERRSSVLVAPALPYGASGEHAGFPGTLSIGQDALETVLVELGRSCDDWAGVLFVSGHGGNGAPLQRAVALLRSESRHVTAWSPRTSVISSVLAPEHADSHAGLVETSLMLALDPSAVRGELAEAGNKRPIEQLLPDLMAGGVRAVSPSGVLGDPGGATAALGQRLFDALVTDLAGAFDRWYETLGAMESDLPAAAATTENDR